MADTDTSADDIAQRKYIVSQLRALDGTPNVCPRVGMFGEAANMIEALSSDLEAMRAKRDALRARVVNLPALANYLRALADEIYPETTERADHG